MKYLLFLIIALTFAACSDNTIVVETISGPRHSVSNSLYTVGDTVYLQTSSMSNTLGTHRSISEVYWTDTTYITVFGDGSKCYTIIEKAVVIAD